MSMGKIAARMRRPDLADAVADGLALAAAPTFAALAIVSAAAGGGAETICSAAGANPLVGMTAMYALMSAFHCIHWLRRAAAGRANI